LAASSFSLAITDLFSRKVVGWALGDRLDSELSCEALRRALARRNPPRGLIFHSDRGSEFAAGKFRQLLEEVHALQSMSRRGTAGIMPWPRASFSTLEFEGPDTATWRYVSDAEPEMFTFIESYYNQTRLHSYNHYRTPNEVG